MNLKSCVKGTLVSLALCVSCLRYASAQDSPVPDWVFSPWVWEDESTQESVRALVNDYRQHGIAVGAVIIDSPWATDYNTFTFNPSLFPAPRELIDGLHADGVRVMLWATSIVNRESPQYEYAASRNYFLKAFPGAGPGSVSWWKGKGSLLDYFNPEAVGWWHGELDKALALGIDGWKVDGVDPFVYMSPYSPGAGRFIGHHDYADKYYSDFFQYTRERLGTERVITARPVDFWEAPFRGLLDRLTPETFRFAPQAVNVAGWVGDQRGTFEGLGKALDNMRASARLGYLAFGSDIGGYMNSPEEPLGRAKGLFIRWAQLGAFSPIMENGGQGEHRPWEFDEETTAIYRGLTTLRMRLKPYLMATAQAAWGEGRSLMRFVSDDSHDFFLGEDLFVAPLESNANDRSVTLPAGGEWVYLYSREKVVPGGETVRWTYPLSEYPVFVRRGSVLERGAGSLF